MKPRRLAAYGLDQAFCRMSLERELPSGVVHRFSMLKGRGRKCSICLDARIYTDGKTGEPDCIYLPLWVLDMVDAENGDEVEISEQGLCLQPLDTVDGIQLLFKCYWSYQHWDESTCPPEEFLTWQNKWPTGVLSARILQKLLPSLMHSRVLVHGSLVAVDALDLCLLFEVHLAMRRNTASSAIPQCADDNEDLLLPAVQIECKTAAAANIFKILTDGEKRLKHGAKKTAEEAGRPRVHEELHFFRHAYKRIVTACQAALLPRTLSEKSTVPTAVADDTWNGVHSILVSGSEGAGKSCLLERVAQELRFRSHEHTPNNADVKCLSYVSSGNGSRESSSSTLPRLEIFEISAKGSEKRTVDEYDKMACVDINDAYSLATHLMSILDARNEVSFSRSDRHANPVAALFLIDDVDVILTAMKEDATDEDGKGLGGTASSGTADVAAAYYLRLLLKALARGVDDENYLTTTTTRKKAPIFVIGATRIPVTSLPRSQIGAPEFENVVALPRPSPQDRNVILRYLFEKSDYTFDVAPQTPELSTSGRQTIIPNEIEDGCPPLYSGTSANNLSNWAMRVAGMTSGYLPGDLKKVVEKAIEEHKLICAHNHKKEQKEEEQQGGTSIQKEEGSVTTDLTPVEERIDPRKEAIKWTTMLSALAASPPVLLKQLDGLLRGSTVVSATSGGVTVGGMQRPLCWDDFAGYAEVKTTLQRLIKVARMGGGEGGSDAHRDHDSGGNSAVSSDSVLTNREKKPSFKLSNDMARGIVLHGPTGCGKTFLAQVVAAEANMNFVPIRSTDLLSPYFGQTEAAIRNLFAQARAAAPCLLFFDEFDALAYKRGADTDDSPAGLHTRILSTFLNEMDGVVAQSKGDEDCILVLAACANLTSLDDALLRPGRLQHHIEVQRPTATDIEAILRKKAENGGMRLSDDVDFCDITDVLVQRCIDLGESPSGAHIEKLCGAALSAAVHEAIGAPDKYPEYQRKIFPSNKELFPEQYEEEQRRWEEEVQRAKEEGFPPLIIADEPLVPPEIPGQPLPQYRIDRIYRRHFMKAINNVFPRPVSNSRKHVVATSESQHFKVDHGFQPSAATNTHSCSSNGSEHGNSSRVGGNETFSWSGSFSSGSSIHN